MRFNIRVGAAIAGLGALAIAVPAAAHPGKSHHRKGTDHPSAHSHHCSKAHHVAYLEGGKVDGTPSTLAKNGDGTWSGTLVVDITHANHWARADRDKTVTYTFSSSKLKVHFDGGTTGFSAGERVQLIGKLAVMSKTCTASGSAPAAPIFRMVVVHPAGHS